MCLKKGFSPQFLKLHHDPPLFREKIISPTQQLLLLNQHQHHGYFFFSRNKIQHFQKVGIFFLGDNLDNSVSPAAWCQTNRYSLGIQGKNRWLCVEHFPLCGRDLTRKQYPFILLSYFARRDGILIAIFFKDKISKQERKLGANTLMVALKKEKQVKNYEMFAI